MRSVNPYLLAIPAILATTILWGLSFSSTKVLLETLLPGQLLGGAVVLSGVSLVTVPDSGKKKPAASCAGKSG